MKVSPRFRISIYLEMSILERLIVCSTCVVGCCSVHVVVSELLVIRYWLEGAALGGKDVSGWSVLLMMCSLGE